MASDAAAERLKQIEHFVVVMMENRSFDHMLGYQSLPADKGGLGRSGVDGLTGSEANVFDGQTYPIAPMGAAGLTKVQDPGHSGADVGHQMAHGMSGFVANYMTTRAYQDGGDVMRYQTAQNVPVYDFFAKQFAIGDRWFCSIPGSTWPNRLAALTGEAESTDNKFPPLYDGRSFVRWLPKDVTWRWYSSDPGSLRLVDGGYRIGHEDNFAYVEKPSFLQPRTFYTDALKEELPNISWIDPNFVDLGGLQGANDDHPPTDVMAGQSFVLKIYEALRESALWEKSMLIVVYDEHGGFYDHVHPDAVAPEKWAQRAQFRHFGPRVPALFVSPFVEAGAVFGSPQGDDTRFLFDHTALIKTFLTRFPGGDQTGVPERVKSSSHLGHVLTEGPPRPGPEIDTDEIEAMSEWWGEQIEFRLKHPSAVVPALQELGVMEGPAGVQAPLQGFAAIVGRVSDWVRKRLGRPSAAAPAAGRRAGPALERRAEPAHGPTALADANELELGIATAARHLRGDLGLPSGQP